MQLGPFFEAFGFPVVEPGQLPLLPLAGFYFLDSSTLFPGPLPWLEGSCTGTKVEVLGTRLGIHGNKSTSIQPLVVVVYPAFEIIIKATVHPKPKFSC